MLKKLQEAAEFAAATKNQDKNFYLGCIGLRLDGAVVRSTNITVIQNRTPSAHAEARVLRKTGYGATLWIARILKGNGDWGLAKPCPTCCSLIINKGVKRVYYTIGPNEYGIWQPERN